MQSEELTPSDWCIVTERAQAYLVIDYTRDPLGVATETSPSNTEARTGSMTKSPGSRFLWNPGP